MTNRRTPPRLKLWVAPNGEYLVAGSGAGAVARDLQLRAAGCEGAWIVPPARLEDLRSLVERYDGRLFDDDLGRLR